MKKHFHITITTSFAILSIAGCATIATLTEPETKNKIFSGTIRHIDLQCAHATCLDFPFSLVADTVILPATIMWTTYNFIKSDTTQTLSGQSDSEK